MKILLAMIVGFLIIITPSLTAAKQQIKDISKFRSNDLTLSEKQSPSFPGSDAKFMISDSLSFRLVNYYPHYNCCAIHAKGDTVYYSSDSELKIVDFSDPHNPISLNQIHFSENISQVYAQDSLLFLGRTGGGVQIYNISNLEKIYKMGLIEHGSNFTIKDNWIYLANYPGLLIVDFFKPAHLQIMGAYFSDGFYHSVMVKDTFCYLFSGGHCFRHPYMQIVDISQPWKIEPRGIVESLDLCLGPIECFVFHENYLLGFDTSLSPINIADPDSPYVDHSFSSDWPRLQGYNAILRDGLVYASSDCIGLSVFNITDLYHIKLISNFHLKYVRVWVTLGNKYIYLMVKKPRHSSAISLTGIYVLELTDQATDTLQLVYPKNNSALDSASTRLTWYYCSSKNAGDSLHFSLELAADSIFAHPVPGSPFQSQVNPERFNPEPPVHTENSICQFALSNSLPNGCYYWRITSVNREENRRTSEIWKFNIGTTQTEEKFYKVPNNYELYQNYPNPFNSTTTISYRLSEPGKCQLQIFDVNGKLVRDLVNGFQPAGAYSLQWDGRDAQQQPVTSGMYFCRLSAKKLLMHRKLVLMK